MSDIETTRLLDAAKQALEALEKVNKRAVIMGSTGDYREGQLHALQACSEDVTLAIASLRQAFCEAEGRNIAEAEKQKPVAIDNQDLTIAYMSGVYDERARQKRKPLTDLKEVLVEAMSNKKPVAWVKFDEFGAITHAELSDGRGCDFDVVQAGYTPLTPQREWVGLTDEEVADLVEYEDWYNFPADFAKTVEAKLKEKNT